MKHLITHYYQNFKLDNSEYLLIPRVIDVVGHNR
jgi:hypothetical protein